MKSLPLALALLFSLFLPVPAQDSASAPAPGNVGGAEYPRIGSDGRVTFRFKAPEAKKPSKK